MKDFCNNEQVFFNDIEKISYLKQRSNNHFQLYKKAFEKMPSIMFGTHRLYENPDADFQRVIQKLKIPSHMGAIKRLS